MKIVDFIKAKWLPISLIIMVMFGAFIYRNSDSDNLSKPLTDNKTSPAEGGGRKQSKNLYVNYEIVRTEPISESVNTTGTLVPDEEVELKFETSGKVTSVNFKEGSIVRKGDLLATVNDLPLQAQLKKLKAQLPLAENRVFRQRTLLDKDAVSQESYEQVVSELEQLKAEIELVSVQIEQTKLKAPFDGYVGLRMVSEGGYVTTSSVVSRLTKISPMKIDFSVAEKYASSIKPGMKVFFKGDSDQKPAEATVYALEAMIDQSTHTRAIRALFQNESRKWTPGSYVSVEILLNNIPNAISVPTEALVPELGIDKVFLYKSGKSEPAEVTIGIRTDSRVQVLSGLQIGDTVITSGTLQLRKGRSVILNN